MKLVLSRKGFDSTYGRSPSPIMEDGKIISLPIPSSTTDTNNKIRYEHIHSMGFNVGKIVEDLTKGKVRRDQGAHLDPDICFDSYQPRPAGWKGLFGQCGAAQGHLRNQKIKRGDIFLFYGYFRYVKQANGNYYFDNNHHPVHLIWAWMQVDDVLNLNTKDSLKQYQWAEYHPHNNYYNITNNTLYVATDKLTLDGMHLEGIKGYGVLPKYRPIQQLTAPDALNRTDWRLPGWMYQEGKSCPLTYNSKREWTMKDGYAYLKAYSRGQEYVLDCTNHPEATEWIKEILVS